ncbi:MAG TPA: cell division protein ZapA [Gammaproteobacteria bacterium]|nr:cell division protein ZapA [Gammaproteobacteria bacterium]
MADEPKQVPVRILDKEYVVGCAPSEEPELIESARVLDAKMREIRDGGKVVGLERVAVMAALNLAHEVVRCRHDNEHRDEALVQRLQRMQEKIDAVLENDRQMEL